MMGVAFSGAHSLESFMKSRRHAFTLIELLVVISIVALLVAILLPVLGAAKEASNKVICASNLHQISVATTLYNADFKDAYPQYTGDVRPYLAPYMGITVFYPAPKVFLCPTSLNKPVVTWDSDANAPFGGAYYSDAGNSYGWNCHLQGSWDQPYWWDAGRPMTSTRVSKPSNVMWSVDCTSSRFDAWYGPSFLSGYRHGGTVDLTDWVLKPGAAGFNAVFVDGHAAWVTWETWREWMSNSWADQKPFAWR